MKQHRQGDVLLIPIRPLGPEDDRRETHRGKTVLALGEGSGHAHVIEGPIIAWNSPAGHALGTPAFSEGGVGMIMVIEPSTLIHESIRGEAVNHAHAPQIIEPGWYEVRTQVPEYRPVGPARMQLDFD